MIVDCHTHIDCKTAEQLATQDSIDKYIVLACAGDPAEKVNSELSEYVKQNADKMIGFGFVDPTVKDFKLKYVNTIAKKLGLKGLVVYCSDCDFHPCHSKAMNLYEAAEKAQLPVFFHNSGNLCAEASLQYARPFLIDEIARTFKGLKIIIGNMGVPFVDQTLALIAKQPNVYADLTIREERIWQLYTTVLSAYEAGVMDKLLFGSGYPHGEPGMCIEALLGFNKRLGDSNLPAVPRDELKKIVERDTLAILGVE